MSIFILIFVMIALATITRIMNTIRKEIGLDVAGIASDTSVKKTTNDNKIVIPNDSLSPHSFGKFLICLFLY
jgi:hypothetical protein